MSTVTKMGYCRFCQESRLVEVPEDATQEEVNLEVTEQCDCHEAQKAREDAYQKKACIANIDEMLGERYPEIADIFISSIDAMQEGAIKKITVNTLFSHTARMYSCKDGIKVELEKKTKAETLA